MNLQTCENLAKFLITKHLNSSWSFEWCRATRVVGVCWWPDKNDNSRGIIRLSINWVVKLTQAEVTDTILHEIAHAKAGFHAHHGQIWQHWAVKLGANPSKWIETATSINPKFVAVSPIDGKVVKNWMNMPSQRIIDQYTKERWITGHPETRGKIRIMTYAQYKRVYGG